MPMCPKQHETPPTTPPSLSPPFLKRIETLRRSDALSYAYAATHIVDMAEGALRHAYAAGWKVFVECLAPLQCMDELCLFSQLCSLVSSSLTHSRCCTRHVVIARFSALFGTSVVSSSASLDSGAVRFPRANQSSIAALS